MESLLAEVIKKCPSSSTLIIGADINAQVGNCDNWDYKDITVKFGIQGTNERGVSLASLLNNFNLKVIITFSKNVRMPRTALKRGLWYYLLVDLWPLFIRTLDFKRARDTSILQKDLVDLDHHGICLKFYIHKRKPPLRIIHQRNKTSMHCRTSYHAHKRIIWSKLYNSHHLKDYNKTLQALLEDCENTNRNTFTEALSRL